MKYLLTVLTLVFATTSFAEVAARVAPVVKKEVAKKVDAPKKELGTKPTPKKKDVAPVVPVAPSK